MDISPKKSAVK